MKVKSIISLLFVLLVFTACDKYGSYAKNFQDYGFSLADSTYYEYFFLTPPDGNGAGLGVDNRMYKKKVDQVNNYQKVFNYQIDENGKIQCVAQKKTGVNDNFTLEMVEANIISAAGKHVRAHDPATYKRWMDWMKENKK